MNVLAPAKINPFLSVGARRADGYHELVSIMQSVSVFDVVSVSPAAEFSIDDPLSLGDANLALRAARTLASLQGAPAVALALSKQIPVAAGLAGGSSDAAAALVGVNALFELGVSRKALEKIGATLGADVPFCVRGGTAAARGIGEELSSLPVRAAVWWALGISAASLSTTAVFAEFDRLGGGAVGDPYEVADALARGDVARLGAALRNDLEPAALSLEPSLEAGRAAMLEAGAYGVVLAGSGPTWCALALSSEHANEIASAVASSFARVEAVHSIDHGAKVDVASE